MFWKRKEKDDEVSCPEKQYSSLDERMTDYRKIFDEKGFTYRQSPETRGMLDYAMQRAAKADLPRDMNSYFKGLLKKSIDEKMVERRDQLDPHKIKDAPYTDEMIDYFKTLVMAVNYHALEEKSVGLKERWLNSALRRAVKGHSWDDVQSALYLAGEYASFSGETLETKATDLIWDAHEKGILAYGQKNADIWRNYVARRLAAGLSPKKFKMILSKGKHAAGQLKADFWNEKGDSYIPAEILVQDLKTCRQIINGEPITPQGE